MGRCEGLMSKLSRIARPNDARGGLRLEPKHRGQGRAVSGEAEEGLCHQPGGRALDRAQGDRIDLCLLAFIQSGVLTGQHWRAVPPQLYARTW